MGKKNEKNSVDIALHWAKKLDEEMQSIYPLVKEFPTPEEVRTMFLLDTTADIEESCRLQKKYPILYGNISQMRVHQSRFDSNGKDIYLETLRDMDSSTLVQIWARNKQVFSFDADFLDELINTETQIFTENEWDYLPYTTFYVDLSAHKELSEQVGNGFFLKIEKTDKDHSVEPNHYIVHLCRVNETFYFSDVLSRKNENAEVTIDKAQTITVDTMNYGASDVRLENVQFGKYEAGTATLNIGIYDTLVMQILTYLSSIEPDIKEDEVTKRTYRKPAPNAVPKNKFSEVQKWNVGNEFGISYRRWKKEREASHGSGVRHSEGTGTKKRPHSRKAHWSHYWYGTGDNKVRRPKWISATFVNASVQSDDGVTVTKVGN